ncbi:MAG: hypothetical protein D6728_11405 [Cyanobacteria bacterium J055]|nr:MAG: hypothetical protein D6728_11405 [Cyanobacteria bacterium J055]
MGFPVLALDNRFQLARKNSYFFNLVFFVTFSNNRSPHLPQNNQLIADIALETDSKVEIIFLIELLFFLLNKLK